MRASLLACVVMLCAGTACDNPPLSLRFRLTGGDSQQCIGDTGVVTTSCQDVTMLCDAYVSIRVLNPKDPGAPYISICESLKDRAQNTLCGIAGTDLTAPATPVPEQTLEVQIAIFPASEIRPDPITGEPVCPIAQYASNGLPVPVQPLCEDPDDPFSCAKVPAVGGRTYFHPGDEKTVVDLGCTDLEQLTSPNVCMNVNRVTVSATVSDFDDLVSSVDKTVADRLNVNAGEPTPVADTFELKPGDSFEVARTTSASTPAWSSVIDAEFMAAACLEVREDVAGTTTALTCKQYDGAATIQLPGVYLKKTTLTQVLGALGMTTFPDTGGLVIGMVLDENSNPLAGQPVSCSGCTVEYLSANRTAVVPGGTTTTTSGVFVSRDAPFGTIFSIPAATAEPGINQVLGGIVEGKVTIVKLLYKEPVVGGG